MLSHRHGAAHRQAGADKLRYQLVGICPSSFKPQQLSFMGIGSALLPRPLAYRARSVTRSVQFKTPTLSRCPHSPCESPQP